MACDAVWISKWLPTILGEHTTTIFRAEMFYFDPSTAFILNAIRSSNLIYTALFIYFHLSLKLILYTDDCNKDETEQLYPPKHNYKEQHSNNTPDLSYNPIHSSPCILLQQNLNRVHT
jgi:hypothetical protein